MKERDYYLAFSNFSGIGPIKFKILLKTFGSAKKIWDAPEKDLEKILKSLTPKFVSFRKEFNFSDCNKKLKLLKIGFVAFCDKEYPESLKQIPNPPIVLYLKGDKKLLSIKNAIGVVGTRKITQYGREITEMFAGSLSQMGFVVVSGMAFGVDGVAHKATIDAEGKTIAVLGNGVDLPYPKENERLYEEILDSGGAVVSEFAPSQPPSMGSFPSRNRIIAGLSLGVLVTEGAQDSGSLITADYAFKFKRKVFAVPGPITSQLSVAPLKLIEKGAKLVTSAGDIAKELNVKAQFTTAKQNLAGLSKEELKVVEILQNEALIFNEIVQKLDSDSQAVGTLLSMMEIKGIIKNSDGKYSLYL